MERQDLLEQLAAVPSSDTRFWKEAYRLALERSQPLEASHQRFVESCAAQDAARGIEESLE